jgi:hypothetical protein
VVGTEATLVQHWGGSRYLPKPKQACLQRRLCNLALVVPAILRSHTTRSFRQMQVRVPITHWFLGRPCPIRVWAYQDPLRTPLVIICPKIQRGRQIK